jgi:hypothetical protein
MPSNITHPIRNRMTALLARWQSFKITIGQLRTLAVLKSLP